MEHSVHQPWIVTQTIEKLLFAHWYVAPENLRPYLPLGLELDLHEGLAWLGVVPFAVRDHRMRGLPPIPFTSRFLQLNVRTYVTYQGRPGIYFFSCATNHRFNNWLGHVLFHLTSIDVEMEQKHLEGEGIQVHCRQQGRLTWACCYRPTGAAIFAQPGSLEHWLIERRVLFTQHRGSLYSCEVQHHPWLLQPAEAEFATHDTELTRHLTARPPLRHYAEACQFFIPYVKVVN